MLHEQRERRASPPSPSKEEEEQSRVRRRKKKLVPNRPLKENVRSSTEQDDDKLDTPKVGHNRERDRGWERGGKTERESERGKKDWDKILYNFNK